MKPQRSQAADKIRAIRVYARMHDERGTNMTLRKLERKQWSEFCERVSVGLVGKRAEIEVASLAVGAQVEVRWLPIVGLVYDHRSDMIEILLEGVEHCVRHPRELYVEYGSSGIESLGIVDDSRAWQIILLRDPLLLPAPPR